MADTGLQSYQDQADAEAKMGLPSYQDVAVAIGAGEHDRERRKQRNKILYDTVINIVRTDL